MMEHKVYTPNEADLVFQPPEFLYKIILVCMFFGFILFLIFFALARYLKYQNRCRALLISQQEREAVLTAQFPPGFDSIREHGGENGEMPILVIQSQRDDSLKESKDKGDEDTAGIYQPLNSCHYQNSPPTLPANVVVL